MFAERLGDYFLMMRIVSAWLGCTAPVEYFWCLNQIYSSIIYLTFLYLYLCLVHILFIDCAGIYYNNLNVKKCHNSGTSRDTDLPFSSDGRWYIKMWVFPYFEYPCMRTSPFNCQNHNAWCNLKRTSKQKASIRW